MNNQYPKLMSLLMGAGITLISSEPAISEELFDNDYQETLPQTLQTITSPTQDEWDIEHLNAGCGNSGCGNGGCGVH